MPIEEENITALYALPSSSPDDAAKNIAKSQELDIPPESYKDLAFVEDTPQEASGNVTRWIAKSTEHAALARPDLEKLSTFERQWRFASDSIKGSKLRRKMNSLYFQKAMGNTLSADDQFDLDYYTKDIQKLTTEDDFDYNMVEALPGQLAGIGFDLGQAIWEGKSLTALGALGGGVAGGVLGFFSPAPGGALVGAKGLAVTGATLATVFGTIPIDTYRQSTGGIYNELGGTELLSEGTTEEVETKRRNLAIGGGLLMAGVSLLPVTVAARKIPFLKQIVSPRAFVQAAGKSVNNKWAQLAIDLAQSGLAEGFEEGSQEAIEILTKAIGDTWDGDETSFHEGLSLAIENWQANLKQVGRASFVGAVAGGTFTLGGKGVSKIIPGQKIKVDTTPERKVEVDPNVVKLPNDLVGDVKTLSVSEQGTRALTVTAAFKQAIETTRDTKLNELSPEQMDVLRQDIFADHGVPHIYLEKKDLVEWAGDTEEKVTEIENLIGDSDINAPIRIDSAKFARIGEKFEDILMLAKTDPEAVNAKNFIDSVGKEDTNELLSEFSYENQPGLNEEQTKVREEVSSATPEIPEMNAVTGLETQHEFILAEEIRRESAESDANIALVEDFMDNSRTPGDPDDAVTGINPDTLSEDLQAKYLRNETLVKRKVFKKTGMDIRQAVNIFGTKDVEQLMEILSTTPTRAESVENARKISEAESQLVGSMDSELTGSKLAKAYNKSTRSYLRKMSEILDNFKGNIFFPIPKPATLRTQARNQVGDTQLKHINPNQWKIGERRSHELATKAEAENNSKEALAQNLKAAENTQLAKESHIAVGRVNRAFEFIARLNSKNLRNQLANVNPVYENAINTILQLFKLGSLPDIKFNIDAYNSFVNKMVKEGGGDFRISEENQLWLSSITKVEEMTVDQLLFLTDKLRSIVKKASLENELLGKYVSREATTNDLAVEEMRTTAIENVDYDPDKAFIPQGAVPLYKKGVDSVKAFDAALTNLQFFMLRLDSGKVSGKFSQNIYQRLMGTGIHSGETGHAAKVKMQGTLKKRFVEHIEKYGSVDFKNLGVVPVFIPEFRNIIGLNKGKLTKLELLTMLMHMGNPENMKALSNFGVKPKVVMAVLKRELGKRDFDFVQEAIWNEYVQLRPRVDKLELETTGVQLEFVEAVGFEAFGKQYAGGYFPIQYQTITDMDTLIEEQKRSLELSDPTSKSSQFPTNAYRGIVKSSHTKERVGGDWELDLGFETVSYGFENVLHDLTMRVPVRDVLTLLADPILSKDIKSIVGVGGYNTISNMAAEQTNSLGVHNMKLFGAMQKTLRGVLQTVDSAFSVNVILFNPSSVVMSSLAIPEIINKMGIKTGGRYLSMAVLKAVNPVTSKTAQSVYELAREIDPSIDTFALGVDSYDASSLNGVVPQKRLFQSKTYNLIKSGQERAVQFGFSKVLGGIDNVLKTVAVTAAYDQYRNGDAPGHPMSELHKLSEEDLHKQAKGYAEQFTAGVTMRAESLSKAPVQKIPGGRLVSKFWNESRNVLLSRRQDIRKMKIDSGEVVRAFKANDIAAANTAFYGIVGDASRMALMSMFGLAIINAARGRREGDEEVNLEDIPDWMLSKVTTLEGAKELVTTTYLGNMILMRDMVFSAESGRGLSFPLLAVGEDVKKTLFQITPYVLESIRNELTLIEIAEGLRADEVRTLQNMLGYALGGLPVAAFRKATRSIEDNPEAVDDVADGAQELALTIGVLTGFIERHDDPNQQEGKKDTLQQAVDQAKTVLGQLSTGTKDAPLQDEEYEVIKQAESGGQWNASPATSSAFGLYQFTKGTWDWLINTPEGKKAGLVKKGRLSRRPEQQEKGMRVFTKLNADRLRKFKVAVNIDTLYFAHFFGHTAIKYAPAVFNGKSSDPVPKGLLTDSVLNANPKLKKDKTVGGVRKHLRRILDRAQGDMN